MMAFFATATTVFAAILLVPTAVFFVECLAALRLRPTPPANGRRPLPRTTILMPAHDEAGIIGQTLDQLEAELPDGSDVVVVADNCRDDTAAIARHHGATVHERHEPSRPGKGNALQYGVAALAGDPPDVVIILDADCHVERASLARLAEATARSGVPRQAVYLLRPPSPASTNDLLSAFAFAVKNQVRPLGLYNLGQPCLLTGSGMAFPWQSLASFPLATDNIVEDMRLGLELALAGQPPRLCPEALVTGDLPRQRRHALRQRTRWEHGHIHTTLTQVPRLLWAAMTRRNAGLLALALEQSIPPLALLVLLWAATALAALAVLLRRGSPLGALLTGLGGFLLLTAVIAAWQRCGRRLLPARTLWRVPLYVLWKLPLYVNYLTRRQRAWIRTERE